MVDTAGRPRHAIVVSLLVLLAGCGGSDSPSTPSDPSAIVVESETLVPVSSESCHVQGTVLNNSDDVTYDVVLRWQAFDAAEKSLGTTRVTLTRLRPGERRAYDATGFASNDRGLVPCSKIVRFEQISLSVTPR